MTTAPTDPTARFFAELGERGYEPLLRKVSGTVKFEVVDGKRVDRWFATIDKGAISVSRRNVSSDGLLRANRDVFESIATGRANPIACFLRGDLAIEGDWRLLVLVQRIFPGPPKAKPGRRRAGYAKRR